MARLNLLEAGKYSLRSLRTASLRSMLTIIGIVIGVVALVVILSISEGVQADINKQLSAFGPENMFIVPVNIGSEGGMSSFSSAGPAMPSMGKLFQRDADAVEATPGVKSVARVVYGRASLQFRDKEITSAVFGMDRSGFDQYGDYMELETGRLYEDNDGKVVVLANDAANVIWGKDKVGVGNVIRINGEDYRVVGILKRIGTAMSQQDDASIYVPFRQAQDLFSDQLTKDEINLIFVETEEGFDPNDIKDSIERKLASYHKVTLDELDFSVITSEFIMETVGAVIGMLGAFLLAITVVASIVGAIGISNTMFMGVLERVGEIGVMKAMGATGRDIMTIFVIESGLLGLIGGVIGLVLGIGILFAAGMFDIPYALSPTVFLFAFVFSAGTGIAAGILPAREAAKMDPVEALRY